MENASKTLLIAGAVLLVIALIAVGMSIFGTARGVVDNAEGQIDNMKIQMHNQQFEAYNKTTLTGKEAKELIATVISNNAKATSKTFRVELWLDHTTSSGDWQYVYLYDNAIESYSHDTTYEDVNVDFINLYNNVVLL